MGVRYTKTVEHAGTATLWQRVGDGSVQVLGTVDLETMPYRQSLYGMDIGRDLGPTVSAAYVGPNEFQGTLLHVEFRLENDRDDLRAAAVVEAENALVDQ